jgi:hypothetical protein
MKLRTHQIRKFGEEGINRGYLRSVRGERGRVEWGTTQVLTVVTK